MFYLQLRDRGQDPRALPFPLANPPPPPSSVLRPRELCSTAALPLPPILLPGSPSPNKLSRNPQMFCFVHSKEKFNLHWPSKF